MPVVSVVIPTYNDAEYLSRAIESVLGQTFSEYELLVIDDGSVDNTSDVVRGYMTDPRVKYIYQPNRGLSSARNTGIRISSGELLAFLDADDSWLPEKLELQTTAMQNPDFGACYGIHLFIYPHNRVEAITGRDWDGDDLYTRLLFGGVLQGCTSSIVVRRECFEQVGMFDESLVSSEDKDMWLRLALRYRFKYVDEPLIRFDRSRTDNMSSDALRMAKGTLGVLQNLESDMPERFRHLLPRVRRFHYLRVARYYRSAGRLRECLRYCAKALAASPTVDASTLEIASLVAKSLIPTSLRRRYQTLAS